MTASTSVPPPDPTATATTVTTDRTRRWPAFDVCGPLPQGTTVLEASAGTGKTYALAALTARFVVEERVPLSRLLLITFGRMATTELRTRVRDRLVGLERVLAAGAPAADDPVDAMLQTVDADERAVRRALVVAALRDFDEATIATTHEFCLQALDGLGVLGDAEPHATVVDQVDDLVDEVASDTYLQRYADSGRSPWKRLADAQAVARDACRSVGAPLVPDPDDEPGALRPDALERVAYARVVRVEVERRMRATQTFTYDDLLVRLRTSLTDTRHGEAAAARLRERYEVVLVDEFQDTDPVQWDILRTAFADRTRMVLIGDPKQAIYGFRGADVHCYLDARDAPGTTVQTLPTNHRSDPSLVAAFEDLLGGLALGERGIVVDPVGAAHRVDRLSGDPALTAPVRLRVAPYEADGGKPVVDPVRKVRGRVTRDLVADVTRLLASGTRIDLGRAPRTVDAGDIAVLVRTNRTAEEVRAALVDAHVPTVVRADRSVFVSEAAQDWATLLLALDSPTQGHVRAATLTCFFGWSVNDLARADDDALIDVTLRVRGWRRVLQARGVAALMEAVTADRDVAARLLGHGGGARRLTDLRHLAELLHDVATRDRLGPGALLEWFGDRVADAHRDVGVEGSRRLDAEGRQVTVVTVHRSKGLQYPIVYLPDAGDRWVSDDRGETLLLHPGAPGDPGRAGLVLDVGGTWAPGRPARFARRQAEEASEDLRLLYVALTRAQCQVVTWWTATHNTPSSALQRVLRSGGGVPELRYGLELGDPRSARPLGPHVRLEPFEAQREPVGLPFDDGEGGPLRVRPFDRSLDLAWRRTSYSSLTAAAHGLDLTGPGVGSEPEPGREDDETSGEAEVDAEAEWDTDRPPTAATGPAPAPAVEPDPWDAVSPMADLPSGADFGTAVHTVLEELDPGAADLAASLRIACAAVIARTGSTGMTPDQLAEGLLPVCATPLGPLAGNRALADVPRSDRLTELVFELPLAGGDDPVSADVRLGDVAPLLRRHLPAADPLAAYADRLEAPVLAEQPLRGYLTGSIDAVLRVRDTPGGPARHLVVDYKTNWLGRFDGSPLTLRAYAPQRLPEAMMAAHYPLQALLYAVALHRMLRWRQPGYDPDVHLGGVLYLFVRGMSGPATPTVGGVPAGVFSWRPPSSLVLGLSELLAGRTEVGR